MIGGKKLEIGELELLYTENALWVRDEGRGVDTVAKVQDDILMREIFRRKSYFEENLIFRKITLK